MAERKAEGEAKQREAETRQREAESPAEEFSIRVHEVAVIAPRRSSGRHRPRPHRQPHGCGGTRSALVENLIRADAHPMEEANSLRALPMLEESKYTVEQLAVKIGKAPSFVASR
jgi:hypothetical protein